MHAPRPYFLPCLGRVSTCLLHFLSMPAKWVVEEPKNCLAVSYACSLLRSEMMKSESKRSCRARRDCRRLSYFVT